MKYINSYKIFERKGNYQLFHKTFDLESILDDGYIKSGGKDNESYWDMPIRKNVIHNWERGKFPTISVTRNLGYRGVPALELDVEKISDNYKIIPYMENPDYYLDFKGNKLEPTKNKNIDDFQNQVRSKTKNAGKEYWKQKTDKGSFDFDIAEEIILAKKLDVSKYVKRIIVRHLNSTLKNILEDKYPHIEVVVLDKYSNNLGYSDIKKSLKQKSKVKDFILSESISGERYSDPRINSIVWHSGWRFEDDNNYPCHIYITNGRYYGDSGGVSNHWHWQRILPNGDLVEEEYGYGDFLHSFVDMHATYTPEEIKDMYPDKYQEYLIKKDANKYNL